MAILRQQAHFIEQLYDSGMVDESEVRRLRGTSLLGLQTSATEQRLWEACQRMDA